MQIGTASVDIGFASWQESGTRRINVGETVQLDTDVVGPFGG